MMTQQRVGGGLHHLEVLALLRSGASSQRQIGHADDAVHGRPGFHGHVGEEAALRTVRLLGSPARPPISTSPTLVLGDLAEQPEMPAAILGLRRIAGNR